MDSWRRGRHAMVGLGLVVLCAGLVVVDGGVAAAAPPLVGFGPHTDYPVGATPTMVAAADLNSDTIPDLVVANGNSSSVSVLLGIGDGTFALRTDYATGPPTAIALGDVNGDSTVDLVVAKGSSNSLSVLLGLGDGTFAPRTDFATANGPGAIALGDLNADSVLDLAVVGAGTVSTFLGVGNGSFTSRHDYATPFPSSVALSDLNGDSVLDVAVANLFDQSVSVFLGAGDSTLRASVGYATDVEPLQVVVGDLNGDSIPDLVLPNVGADDVSVLLGVGDGTFAPRSDIPLPGGTQPRGVAVGDLNGDALLDLAVVGENPDRVSVLLGLGNGGFTSSADFSTGGSPGSVAAADFNGDARLDLAVTNSASNTVSVLLNGGVPSLPGAPTNVTAAPGHGSATVSWTAPASDGGSGVSGYVVSASIDGITQPPVAFDSTATTQTITDLTNGTAYTFTVAAMNVVGTGPQSDASNPVTPTATTPGAPTIIRNATAANQSATISWTAPASDGGSPITGYTVTPYAGYWALPSMTFNSTATTETITGLHNGTTYRFKVAAINTVGTGPTSKVTNPVTPTPTAPNAPTIGTATPGVGSATVSWTAPASDGGSTVTGYVVSPYVGYFPLPAVTFNSTATTQTVTGLTNGTTYRFRVQAINAIGTGPYSKVTNPVTPA